MWEKIRPEGTVKFVLERQRPEGGFSATPLLPVSVEDTYYGLSILGTLLRDEHSGLVLRVFKASKAYLASLLPSASWDLRLLYFYTACSYLVGALSEATLKEIESVIMQKNPQGIEDWFYLLRLQGLMRATWSFKAPSDLELLRWKSIRDLYFSLVISKDLDLPGPDLDVAFDWALGCRNPDGGFGFCPGTTSFMENVYYAMLIFDFINRPPPFLDETLWFILASRSKDGGYGRKGETAPFLDATFYAIKSLWILLCKFKGIKCPNR